MDDVLIIVRAIHYAASAAVAGGTFFRLLVLTPDLRRDVARSHGIDRVLVRYIWGGIAVATATGAAWLLLVAARLGEGSPDVVATLATETRFGQAWLARVVLAAPVAAELVLPCPRGTAVERLRLGFTALCAAAFVMTIAFAGHAAATPGRTGLLHLAADMVHLLAAATWLGALPALAIMLTAADQDDGARAAAAVRRFSGLGAACVAALAVTGSINTVILVRPLEQLADSGYGRLLLLKVLVFLVMAGIASYNRWRLTPDLRSPPSMRSLRRNAIVETALGLAVLAIVAALGVMQPPLHHAH